MKRDRKSTGMRSKSISSSGTWPNCSEPLSISISRLRCGWQTPVRLSKGGLQRLVIAIEQRAQALQGRLFDEAVDGHPLAEVFPDLQQQARQQDGVPAEVEEALVDGNLAVWKLQQRTPQAAQALLGGCPRFDALAGWQRQWTQRQRPAIHLAVGGAQCAARGQAQLDEAFGAQFGVVQVAQADTWPDDVQLARGLLTNRLQVLVEDQHLGVGDWQPQVAVVVARTEHPGRGQHGGFGRPIDIVHPALPGQSGDDLRFADVAAGDQMAQAQMEIPGQDAQQRRWQERVAHLLSVDKLYQQLRIATLVFTGQDQFRATGERRQDIQQRGIEADGISTGVWPSCSMTQAPASSRISWRRSAGVAGSSGRRLFPGVGQQRQQGLLDDGGAGVQLLIRATLAVVVHGGRPCVHTQAVLQAADQACFGLLQQIGAQCAVERMAVGQSVQPVQAVLTLLVSRAHRRRFLQMQRVAGEAGDLQRQLLAQGLQGVLTQLLAIAGARCRRAAQGLPITAAQCQAAILHHQVGLGRQLPGDGLGAIGPGRAMSVLGEQAGELLQGRAGRLEHRAAAEETQDVAQQRMLAVDRVGQAQRFLAQGLAHRIAHRQGVDQGAVESLLDVVGQGLAQEQREYLGDHLAIRLRRGMPVDARQARPEARVTTFVQQVIGHQTLHRGLDRVVAGKGRDIVVAEGRCLLGADAPLVENLLEHRWNDAFPPVQEGGGNLVGRCLDGHFESVTNEPLCRFTGATALQRVECRDALLLQADEAFDGLGACTDFAHGIQIQLEGWYYSESCKADKCRANEGLEWKLEFEQQAEASRARLAKRSRRRRAAPWLAI
ncbi:hypothetical protein WR25_07370 [Diploscapter pachys]|uniref:Uncharacterized protein n=1 Tax=Diploscapter pachys TaxID=2018661 RepID=A0A2A2KIX3_9BILA|nr:hypothetical protein WR25_07370 [Diploscapter pachys]